MAENKELEVIELRKIVRKIAERRKTFYKTMGIVFVLSVFYILCIPRTYTTDTRLAPEMGSSLGGGTLGSIASSFGIDLTDMETNDAITPLLYPDLMDDNQFVASLFPITVTTKDGSLTTTYFEYLRFHQKAPWWAHVSYAIRQLFKPKEADGGAAADFNPYQLSKRQDEVAKLIRSNVKLSVDKKSGVITITVKDQDPVISKTIADSVRSQLQLFITDYRTNKARTDVEYYETITADAKAEYEKARLAYSDFADAYQNAVLQTYLTQAQSLQNEMELKYNAYSVVNTQLQQAISKVQERTPAFTVLKGAEVPIKPTGPKRMIFVFSMLFLTFIFTTIWVARKELHFSF